MPEWWTQLGPIGPIAGALVSVLLGSLFTYKFMHKRKAVLFFSTKPDNLLRTFAKQTFEYSLKIAGVEIDGLYRQEFVVRNIGNETISDFFFDVEISGQHKLFLCELYKSQEMRDVVLIDEEKSKSEMLSVIKISASFFNSKEKFAITVIFDGKDSRIAVVCRLPDVKVSHRATDLAPYSFGSRGMRLNLYRAAGVPRWMILIIESIFKALPS